MNIRRLCKENVRNLSIFMVLSTHYPTFRILIQRKRDSVDPVQARETAMMNFDAEYPEQQQNTGQRLA